MARETGTWLEDPASATRATVIAEIAQAHDGSLGMAHAYIDAAAAAGADAIKFQTHIAAAESTPLEPWRTRFSLQDETRYDYWRRMEFTLEQWQGLRRHADEAGLLFLSSPFSREAAKLLKRVGVAAWKVASGEITDRPMLEMMAETRLPVLVSTGMSPLSEIDVAVDFFASRDLPLCVMQCTTRYPSPPEAIGLNVLDQFRSRYGTAVGLSDHSGTIFPSLAATTLGVDAIEVHVAMSREMFGPDVPASVTTAELGQLVAGVRFIEAMNAHPVDKTATSADVAQLREVFFKSIVARADLPADTVLRPDHLTTKKPGTGIPASEFHEVVGRTLARDVKKDAPLVPADLKA